MEVQETEAKKGLVWGLIGSVVTVVMLSVSVSGLSLGGGEVQRYTAERQLDYGTVVALDQSSDKSNKVVPATEANMAHMHGVVIDPARLSVVQSDGQTEHQVYVASSGTYSVLVSSQNGDITAGDYVTMSALDGVLMKADTEQPTIFGRAAKGFNDSSVSMGSATLKDNQGGSNQVRLGKVPVTIDIKKNPNKQSTKVDVPEFLEDIGQQIAKKEVNPIRIYISLAITAISLITAIVVLYSGVKNGVISIGRNPMSKKSIFRALLEIILTSIAVLMVGLFAVYLLLRL